MNKDFKRQEKTFSQKKSQAAIEFLMTYGWMLLVVLIVGALIFSFIDLDLLPQTLELSTPLISDLGGSSVMVDESDTANNLIFIAFEYVGDPPIRIHHTDATLKYNLEDSTCESEGIYNTVSKVGYDNTTESNKLGVQFRTGHSGFLAFRDCSDFNLIDNIEGNLIILYESVKAGTKLQSSGSVRLNIAEVITEVITNSESTVLIDGVTYSEQT